MVYVQMWLIDKVSYTVGHVIEQLLFNSPDKNLGRQGLSYPHLLQLVQLALNYSEDLKCETVDLQTCADGTSGLHLLH